LSRNGGPGQSAGVFVRGTAASGVVVIVDGVRVGSATLGQTAFEALSLATIERIEVLRGPASSLYGADAVGGVIRISTRRSVGDAQGPWTWRGHARLGSLDSREASASVDGMAGAVDLGLGVARESSRGQSAVAPGDRFGLHNADDDGHARTTLRASAGLEPHPGHRLGMSLLDTRLNAQYDGAEFLPPSFAADPSPDFRNRLNNQVVALDYRGEIAPDWTTTLGLGWQRDDLRSGGLVVDRFVTRRQQLTWQNAWRGWPGQQWVVALDHLVESVDAVTLGALPKRRNTGAVLSWTGRSGAHRWQVDARHDRHSVQGRIDTGKLGWGVDLAGGWALRAVAGTAYRVPTFNDLYFPNFGVTTLRPERSRSVEVGVDWVASPSAPGSARVGLTAYRNRVRDLIGFEADPARCPPGLSFGCAGNVNRATLEGLTATGQWPLWQGQDASVDLGAQLDWLDARDELTGERLARRAPHQQALSLVAREGRWSSTLALLAVGPRREGGQSLGSYQVVDLRLAHRLTPRWQAEVALTNALDQRYQTALDYPALPRQAWVGLRYDGAGR
jgi:vitamin B12 transporter